MVAQQDNAEYHKAEHAKKRIERGGCNKILQPMMVANTLQGIAGLLYIKVGNGQLHEFAPKITQNAQVKPGTDKQQQL